MIVYLSVNGLDVFTCDEQGNCERTLSQFIAHAANRHASRVGGRFFLSIH